MRYRRLESRVARHARLEAAVLRSAHDILERALVEMQAAGVRVLAVPRSQWRQWRALLQD